VGGSGEMAHGARLRGRDRALLLHVSLRRGRAAAMALTAPGVVASVLRSLARGNPRNAVGPLMGWLDAARELLFVRREA
jgi:hypothetical protein